MKASTYTLEFLMPCFCAGADQAVAEVRASAIRGQLRWWFRALGGTKNDETTVFGGTAGNASSSFIMIRVANFERGPAWPLPQVSPNSPDSYVWHFPSVSGKQPGSGSRAVGPRWNPSGSGVIPPQSKFLLQIHQRGRLKGHLQDQLDLTVESFLQLGAIGLRVTRGLGSFLCHEIPFKNTLSKELQSRGFRIEHRPNTFNSVGQLAKEIGSLVKGTRKSNGWKIDSARGSAIPSPFGSSSPRQASAVYFRPVRLNQNGPASNLIVFEAPQDRVLGKESRKESVVGHSRSRLVKPSR